MSTPIEYMTVKEVAELLKIAEKTVRKYLWQKQIPYLKIGGHVRFEKTQILAWISEKQVPTIEEIQFGQKYK